MIKSITTEADIEGSEERVSVRYQLTAGGDPKIIDVKAGSIDVTHLIDDLQRSRFKQEIKREMSTQSVEEYQDHFIQQMRKAQ